MTSGLRHSLLEGLSAVICGVDDLGDFAVLLHDTSCRCTESGGRFSTCREADFYRRWVREIQYEISERVPGRRAAW